MHALAWQTATLTFTCIRNPIHPHIVLTTAHILIFRFTLPPFLPLTLPLQGRVGVGTP